VRRGDPAGCVLYGPYLHLPEGCYRLSFSCRSGAPRLAAQPVVGVDVVVLSRLQLEWRDFTAGELAAGTSSLDFAVPRELSLEGANEGRFEFRFFHLGNAGFTITAIDLDTLAPDEARIIRSQRHRLLGRLETGWRGGGGQTAASASRAACPPARFCAAAGPICDWRAAITGRP